MVIRSQKDFASGIVFAVVGGVFAFIAAGYEVGSSDRIGPGYFPLAIGCLLALVGIVVAIRALGPIRDPGEVIGQIGWKPLIVIVSANILFGILLGGIRAIGLPPMGLLVTATVVVVVASMAGDEFRLRGALLLAGILAVFTYVVFAMLLHSSIDMLPPFLNRF